MAIPENDILKIEKRSLKEYISKLETVNNKLQSENVEMKEKLENYIPRRRVRRVFRQLKAVLEQDLENDNKIYIKKLKVFIQKIEKEGTQPAGQDIKQAIEHVLSICELKDPDETILYADGAPVQILQKEPKEE